MGHNSHKLEMREHRMLMTICCVFAALVVVISFTCGAARDGPYGATWIAPFSFDIL